MARQNINIGITANDKTGDPVRTAFTKTNANFTELYTNVASISNDITIPINYVDILNAPTDISDLTDTTGILITNQISRLVNNNKQVSLDAAGTLTVPNPTDRYAFQMVLSTTNYVSTLIKPILPLISAPWSFNAEIAYTSSGITELVIVSGSLPSATNPGYSAGDTFTFNTTVHGIPNYTLIITLTDVSNIGFTVWDATLTPSSLPEYPSTIKSLGLIKLTANTSNWTFGTDGVLKLPVDGDIVNSTGTSVLSGGVSTDIYKFAGGVIGTKNDLDTSGWGSYNIVLDPGGESNAGLFIPSVAAQDSNGSLNIYNNRAVGNNISLLVNAGSFMFKGTGTLELPHPTNLSYNDPSIKFGEATSVSTNNLGFAVPGSLTGIVYISRSIDLLSMKLLITIQGLEDGGDGSFHTQVCEMLVVRRTGATINTVNSVVYGVTYTSVGPLATLTAQEDTLSGRINILATPTNSTGIGVKVHATEVINTNSI